ncbi:MAG: hypothetical protein NVS3B16_05730 [Vulcanimicrobiaceae bacterium]
MWAARRVTSRARANWQATRASGAARVRKVPGLAYWSLLVALGIAWAIVLWHPWIDWFGRPR